FEVRSRLIEVKRLDDFNFLDVGAIKIDVEGHEFEVLSGSEETIKKSRPVLIVEIEERHHPGRSSEIIRYVEEMGYVGLFLNQSGHLVSVQKFDFDRYQSKSNLPDPIRGGGGLYLNNFIFIPREYDSARIPH